MKNLENHKQTGFTFIEVVLSIFIIGTLLSSVLLLQSTVVNGLQSASGRAQRIFLLTEELFNASFSRLKKEKKTDKRTIKINDPETAITINTFRPKKSSSLSDIENIMIENITAEWQEWTGKRMEQLVTIVFAPKEKKQ